MPRLKLSAVAVERIMAPTQKPREEHFDTILPGFALRVTDKGSKSWVLFCRTKGRLRRYTIGGYPAFGLAEARRVAREAPQEVAMGNDPAAEKAQRRTGREPEMPDTLYQRRSCVY